MRLSRKQGETLKPATLRAKALAAGKIRATLNVSVFALDSSLPAEALAGVLQAQFQELSLSSQVQAAGPERVLAALAGHFSKADVLVVLGDSSAKSEPALMDLVQWLLLNGQTSLAENLLYAQLGSAKARTVAPVFELVMLPPDFAERVQQSGRRFPWAASSHEQWELADAVLTYATGLAAE